VRLQCVLGTEIATKYANSLSPTRPLRDSEGRFARIDSDKFTNLEVVVRALRPLVYREPVETIGIAYVSAGYQLLGWHVLSRGDRNRASFYPADVFVPACLTPAAIGMFVVHNHPSGDPTPSQADVHMTITLEDAASLLGFELLDHLIIAGSDHYYSFRQSGMLKRRPWPVSTE
jgi:DNA repair protein RadC